MSKKVACCFEGCESRVPVEDFDETLWLPVFKATREHWGFCCPKCSGSLRAGGGKPRYILSNSDGDELVIDMKPLAEEIKELEARSPASDERG